MVAWFSAYPMDASSLKGVLTLVLQPEHLATAVMGLAVLLLTAHTAWRGMVQQRRRDLA